jgi:hypothetical protein
MKDNKCYEGGKKFRARVLWKLNYFKTEKRKGEKMGIRMRFNNEVNEIVDLLVRRCPQNPRAEIQIEGHLERNGRKKFVSVSIPAELVDLFIENVTEPAVPGAYRHVVLGSNGVDDLGEIDPGNGNGVEPPAESRAVKMSSEVLVGDAEPVKVDLNKCSRGVCDDCGKVYFWPKKLKGPDQLRALDRGRSHVNIKTKKFAAAYCPGCYGRLRPGVGAGQQRFYLADGPARASEVAMAVIEKALNKKNIKLDRVPPGS